MGKALDILLGRKSSKLSSYLEHSITRISFLKNRQQALYSFSYSDVVQLLSLGHEEQALLRVEHVIRSKNMLDALTLIESYCHLLLQNTSKIEKTKDWPHELKEAIGSLIFASSRIGDFPELLHIRSFVESKFGQEFVSQAIESPRIFGVNDKIMQRLSRKKPDMETKNTYLMEIASNNGNTSHQKAK